jgi:hypothetical protein
MKFASWPRLPEVLCDTTQQVMHLSVHKMADIPVPGFWKYWTQQLLLLKYLCHDVMNKNPEAASVVQVYKVFSDTEILAK